MEKIKNYNDLKKPSNFIFISKIFIWLMMLFIGMALAIYGSSYVYVLGIFLIGVGIAHGVELSHQALHNTGFSSRKANEIFGVLLGLPLLVSFYEYRISHLVHHAKVGTKDDTEYFDYGDEDISIRMIIDSLTMWRHYFKFSSNFFDVLLGKNVKGFNSRYQSKIKSFYFYSVIMIIGLIVLGYMTGDLFRPIASWLLALLLFANPIHALIEFPEHYKCSNNSTNILYNTRTIKSNYLMSWLTNYNNYHVEHHMFLMIPMQNTPKIYEELNLKHMHYYTSYSKFYYDVFFRKFSNRKSENV